MGIFLYLSMLREYSKKKILLSGITKSKLNIHCCLVQHHIQYADATLAMQMALSNAIVEISNSLLELIVAENSDQLVEPRHLPQQPFFLPTNLP